MQAATARCPNCNASLPDTGRFPVWCPACDWNVEADTSAVEWNTTALEKLIERVRGRYAAKLYEDLVQREPHALRSRWTTGKAAAYGIAAIINLLPLLLTVFGLWVIYANWPSWVGIIWGGILLFAVWALLPGRSRMSKNLLDRTSAPALYALVDEVALASGARKVHSLVVEANWGASFQQFGIRRRSIVSLGLPFWSILSPQERIALLSHEFAHGANRDSLTHGFVGRAIGTLTRFSTVLAPSYEDIFSLLMSPLFALASGFFHWLAVLIVELYWQLSQEAEFRADYVAARIGGSDATQSMLRKTPFASYIKPTLDPISYAVDWRGQNFFPAFRTFLASRPPIEEERMRRAFDREEFATHTSHPPTRARLSFLDRHASPPSLNADAAAMALIDKELEKLELSVTGKLLAAYYPSD